MKQFVIEGRLSRFVNIDYATKLQFNGRNHLGQEYRGTPLEHIIGPLIEEEGWGGQEIKISIEIGRFIK